MGQGGKPIWDIQLETQMVLKLDEFFIPVTPTNGLGMAEFLVSPVISPWKRKLNKLMYL